MIEHMILFAAFGVVWAIVAPRVMHSPLALLGGQVAGLALVVYLCQAMFSTESRRPLLVAVGVYLALAAVTIPLTLQAPFLPETLRDLELARMMGFLGPVIQPLVAFEAGKRAIPD